MVELISAKPKIVKKAVTFRVKESTAKQLAELKQRVKTAGDDVEFHLDEVVDEQLIKLITRANKQLDSLANAT